MDVGLQLIFSSYGWDDVSDATVYAQELAMAELAEELGFDAVWPTEHHFFDYSFCPDNLELLAYVAGRTRKIGLGTAAVILPWNDPLRVAEKVAMLDLVSGGRVRFGMGRGLSQREFAPFRGIAMDESRDRFDEASAMIVEALETGFIRGDGPMYPQVRTEIRPRPERYRHHHGTEAPPTMTADFTFCHEDPVYARERAEACMTTYLQSLLEHYNLMGTHLDDMKGYTGYGKQAAKLREIGFDRYIRGFMASNSFGTPEEMLETYRARHDVIGPFEEAACFRYGGMPQDEALASMRLFAERVLPELQSW